LLASRLAEAARWAGAQPELKGLRIGYFGASTGAGAALLAAAQSDGNVRAIVSRGGRPDLAGVALRAVRTPTLLLVGSLDDQVLDLNRSALRLLNGPKRLTVVPGAGHLFEEPGTLDAVIDHASHWFGFYLTPTAVAKGKLPFADRCDAGRQLAARLAYLKDEDPLILALPRGGVPVAFEVAKALGAELGLLLVRKLGAPGNPEVGIGAVVDGAEPQVVFNEDIVEQIRPTRQYLESEIERQLKEMERRRHAYLGDRPPPSTHGRTVIVVDDGVATGGTVRAALRGLAKSHPARTILAVPVAPADSLASLASECSELVCVAAPEPFHSVGAHYLDFSQTTDEEVKRLLDEAARLGQPAGQRD